MKMSDINIIQEVLENACKVRWSLGKMLTNRTRNNYFRSPNSQKEISFTTKFVINLGKHS